MSTSPISERTVLLWGNRWWLPGQDAPLECESVAQAADVLARHLAGEARPVRLRLIYQPENLVSVAVACPQGNRGALQAALGFEHPEIADPNHAWSYEPILASGEGFDTYLHYEKEPELFPLIWRLKQHGIIVTSAWPLATFLHALPTEWSDSGAVLVLAMAEPDAITYHHPAEGGRVIRAWHGDEIEGQVLAWLQAEIAQNPREPVLVLTADDVQVPAECVGYLPLVDALKAPVVLPRAHPAQLLPAEQFLTAQRAAIAASVLLLLAGGYSGATYAKDYVAWNEIRQDQVIEKSALRTEIEHYRVNASEIVALRAKLTGAGEGPPIGELLDTVVGAMPPQLALDRIQVAEGRFALSGHVAPGAVAVWEQWLKRLSHSRWRVEPAAAVRESGAFIVSGVFSP